MIELRTLGALDVRADRPDSSPAAVTQPKRLALLLYLALAEPAGLHARDRLLALLWPEADEASSRHSLRNALHALRRALGDDMIVTRGEAFVGVDFGRLRCDALALRAHLAAGRLEEAVAAWTGELLPGFHVSGAPEFEHWLDGQREALRLAVRAAAWRCADAKRGESAEVDALRRALQLDPGNEHGAKRLLQLLAGSGDRAGALLAYEAYVEYLARELETTPSAGMQALATSLRAPEPAMPPRQQVTAAEPALAGPLADPVAPVAMPAPARSLRVRRPAILFAAMGLFVLASGFFLARHPAPAATEESQAERLAHRLPARWRADTSAYSSWLRGVTLRFQYRFAESRDTLASLVDRHPLYAPGLAELSQTWIFLALNDLTDPDEAWPRVHALASGALELDSTAATVGAWLSLAAEDMFRGPDLARARTRIARAQALDPGSADAEAMRSVWFRFFGEMDSSIAAARHAHQLDPLSIHFARLVAKNELFARRYDDAWRDYARLYEDDPKWKRGLVDVAQLFEAMGRPREAVAWYRRLRLAQGDSAGAALLDSATTDEQARLRLARDARHRLERLAQDAAAGRRVGPSAFAIEHARLRDTTGTLQWLDTMLVHRDSYLHHARLDPAFDFLRDDPRYAAWDARTGLPPLAPPRR